MKPSTYPMLDAAEVERIVLELTPVLPPEAVPLAGAAGRVAAEDVRAPHALPAFPSSAVDGYAVRAADGGGRLRIVGESAAGHPYTTELPRGGAARILTGGVLPPGADSVVMVEETTAADGWVTVPEGIAAGRNFHAPSADLTAGELVISKGQPLAAAELGLLAAMNLPTVRVGRRPRVALMSTGDELRELGEELEPGQITDSNRYALLAALAEAGADVEVLGIAPDEPAELRRLVEDALGGADVLLTSGGVSVGTHDLVKPLLESLGTVHTGRVKLKPGKPFTFATLPGEKVAFGLPGFPVSSLVTFEAFVRPALRKMQGFANLRRPTLPVRMGYDARAAGDRTEYQRVILQRRGGELIAKTTGSQSSSRLMSMVGAHALVRIPPGDAGIAAGTIVDAIILALPGDPPTST
jgi:molybdopterin molybdotransferase